MIKNHATSSRSPVTWITYLTGAAISVLGTLVLVGWCLHNLPLLQINSSFVAMQVNTAVGFLVTGVAICLAGAGKRVWAAWLGSIAGLIGILTAVEHITGVSLGIDQLLIHNFMPISVKFPGRMAPGTAFCFSLASAGLWAASFPKPGKLWSIGGLFGSVIAGFGIIGALGYYTNLPATFVWGNFSSMAIHTAVGIIVTGIGLMALTLKNEYQSQADSGTWLAGATAFATITVFIGAAQSMLANEQSSIQSKTEVVARAEATQIQTTLKLQVQSIERMADRAEVHMPTETEWRSDASMYIDHSESAYESIKWLTASYQTRWMVPDWTDPSERIPSNILATLYDTARVDRQVKLLKFINPKDGNTKFLVLAPIYQANLFEGLIVAVVNPINLFKKLQIITEQPYGFSVQSGSEVLYGSMAPAKNDLPWIQSANSNFESVGLTVQAWPVKHSYSPAPWLIIAAGLFSAAALAVLVVKSQAVRSKSRELQLIIDTAPVGMLILNAQGLVKQINQHCEQLFGYTRQELLDKQVRSLIPNVINLGDTDQSRTMATRSTECICKDGSTVHAEFGVKNIVIDSQKFILVVLTDITQRTNAEWELQTKSTDLLLANRELKQLQQILQTTMDHMPALVGSWDVSFRNRLGNTAYVDWFGISPQEMQGKHMREIVGDVLFEKLRPYLVSVLKGNTENFEQTIQIASGETRHAMFSCIPDMSDGIVSGYFGFVSDMTLLKQAQITKDHVLNQLQGIISAATDFAIIETDARGLITLFSRGAELLLGYPAQDMVGKARVDIDTVDAPVGNQTDSDMLQLGWKTNQLRGGDGQNDQRESASYDSTCPQRDGTSIPVNQTIVALRAKDGTITGYLGIAKDIRKEQQIMQDLADARDKACAANLAKSQFLANMSHEIRTPMNAILGMQQLLQHSELTPRQLDYAHKTQSAAKALLGLLNDILDFSKVEANKMELEHRPFRLDALLRDLSVICSSSVGSKEIDVLFSLAPNLPGQVVGDEMRLRQVLINLVGNAIKFTHRGAVTISLAVLERQEHQAKISFSIQDSGIGIDPEHLAYIFEGFSQAEASTTRRFGGTGLGLAISQRLVALMGGELYVESTVNQGSRFYFTLPMECADGTAQSEPALASAQTKGSSFRVLIVDNNEQTSQNLRAMVDSLGWQTDVTDNGESALALLRELDQSANPASLPYDLIFIDNHVPGMSGTETAAAIRKLQSSKPELLIILLGTAQEREELSQLPGDNSASPSEFLIKPITASMIFDVANEATLRRPATQPMKWESRLKGLRILVVEDNMFNLQVISEFLTGEGALVENAYNGLAGVERICGKGPALDAVLMDIQMPVMDGYQATRLIRQDARMQSLPIIALTANAMPSDKIASRKAGMNDHIAKPIDLENLINTIQRFCQPKKETIVDKAAASQSVPAPNKKAVAAHPVTQINPPPDLPVEIEVDIAIRRLGGNQSLFIRLARHFNDEAARLTGEFETALSSNNQSDAVRAVHTLMGIAGQLGATDIARYASALEAQISGGQFPTDSKQAVQQLNDLAAKTQLALEKTIPVLILEEPTPNPTVRQANRQLLHPLFDELDQMLKASNTQAITALLKIQLNLDDQYNEEFSSLSEAIHSQNFEQALEISEQIKATLR